MVSRGGLVGYVAGGGRRHLAPSLLRGTPHPNVLDCSSKYSASVGSLPPALPCKPLPRSTVMVPPFTNLPLHSYALHPFPCSSSPSPLLQPFPSSFPPP